MINNINLNFSQFSHQNQQNKQNNFSNQPSNANNNIKKDSFFEKPICYDHINLKEQSYGNQNEEKIDGKKLIQPCQNKDRSRGTDKQCKKVKLDSNFKDEAQVNQIRKLSPKEKSNPVNLSQQLYLGELNYSKIPLCCRTFFFDQQRILPGEDKVTQYKSYRFPFNPISFETFKKTVCGYLNTCGGDIYIGIKQTTNKKYRYVLGNYLTENDKEQIMKTFRKISEFIFPNAMGNLEVEFVPIRANPFPNIDLLGQCQTYFYDFTKKALNMNDCPYLPGRYVVRVRVAVGNRCNLYTYVETEYQLNKNSSSKQFVAFRSQNQVLVKEISNEVLKRYKNRLLYEQQTFPKIHSGPCLKPQIGCPQNQPQNQKIDSKSIQLCLYEKTKRVQTKEREKTVEKNKIQKRSQKTCFANYSQDRTVSQQTNSQSLGEIFRYPLSFVANNITEERLRKCIQKTPAKDYTTIQQEKNILSGHHLLILTVNNYHNMEQFLRVKSTIQRFFIQDKVELIPISKFLRLQSMQNKKIVEGLLRKNSHLKWVINNNVLEFYSLVVAASFYLYIRNLGFEMQALAK